MSVTKLSVCVFCGSRPGTDAAYVEAARELGAAIGGLGWRLIYGAGDVGIMGHVARAAQIAGAETVGVIPVHLRIAEMARNDLTNLVITETMHERKKVMYMNADAVAVLPGGAGSLDEFFEILTWAQLGLHHKPIVILNTKGYWDPLLALIDHVIGTGFAEASLKSHYSVAETVPELVRMVSDSGTQEKARKS